MIPPGGFGPGCRQSYDPSWGPVRPFLTAETDCNPAPVTRLATDVYQRPGPFTAERDPSIPGYPWPYPGALFDESTNWKTYASPSPPVHDCASLAFGPSIDFTPTSDAAGAVQTAADSPAGLDVDLSIPQNNDPPFTPDDFLDTASYVQAAAGHWDSDPGRATAHLKDTVVALPPGVAVNPSGARGLQGCTDAEIGVSDPNSNPLRFDNQDPFDDQGAECPDASIVGTATVDTPLLEQPLDGHVVLGAPKPADIGGPQSELRLRLFIVVKDKQRGLIAKISGTTKTNPSTGDLTAVFENNPEVPFDRLGLQFKDGPRGLLRTSQRCGTPAWSTTFTPWSAAHGAGGAPVGDQGAFTLDQNCAFDFAPRLDAGMNPRLGGAHGTFSFEFDRSDGQQWFKGLTAELPTGLLASVRDVPLCTNAQADANACPPGSRIGSVDASAGAGDPFVLEKKGTVYLTEGYKGAPYGLAVSVPVEAGPFRGDVALTPIVVRQALHVDRTDASVTAVSDPFPHIWHGIPLAVRRVLVKIDRPKFTVNPTSCAAKEIAATFTSTEGATATRKSFYQATACRRLPFKPKLAMRLTGRKQTRSGKHPGIRAVVTQTPGQAAVDKAIVRLPKSLALDVNNAQALCEYADGTKPEPTCPKGSIVGRARASSPLLKRPLAGNVYFVKNIRRSTSGNIIRTLPMIVVALRGEIAINLRGVSSTTKNGRLVNTFAKVPDAPIKRFNLNIKGGNSGILAITKRSRDRNINICRTRQIAEADFTAQNGKHRGRNIHITTPCKNKKNRR